jgi:hypothetical protein
LQKAFAGVPFETLEITDEAARDLYGFDLILLRPDMHVAWRGNRVPQNVNEIAAVSTGHTIGGT